MLSYPQLSNQPKKAVNTAIYYDREKLNQEIAEEEALKSLDYGHNFSPYTSVELVSVSLQDRSYLTAGYNAYEIRITKADGTCSQISRRYSNFEALRKLLILHDPFTIVPPIPDKDYWMKGG